MNRLNRRQAIHIGQKLVKMDLRVNRIQIGLSVGYELKNENFGIREIDCVISLVRYNDQGNAFTKYVFQSPFKEQLHPRHMDEEIDQIIQKFQERYRKQYKM